MKQIFTFAFVLLLSAAAFAQAPNLMNYQAVARNAQGQALASQTIKVRLTLQIGSVLPIPFYSETRTVTTNALGLFNVQVGSAGAQNVTGSVNGTAWLDGNARYLKVEIDPANNGSFVDMGTQQLVSVPYALAAQVARKIDAPFVGFRAQRATNYTLTGGPYWTVPFDHEEFDSTNVFTGATGKFKAPEDGMYHLSYKLMLYVGSASSAETIGNYFHSSIKGALHVNSGGDYQLLENGANAVSNSIITFLQKGEEVSIQVWSHTKGGSWIVHDSGSTFQGYKIK